MVKPHALCPGDKVALVAPASPFHRHEFDEGVEELRRLGLDPVFDDRVFARAGYLAGDARLRAAAIQDAWCDRDVRGVIAVRGGYGSIQILPLLDTSIMRRHTKVFIGYSDLTSVLIYLTITCQQVAFHGPMLAGKLGRGATGYDETAFRKILMSGEPAGELTSPSLEALVAGEASGMLLGGTLTQILSSLGTPYAFDPPPHYVLFIDEVSERPYRLDRMLTQLGQSGLLARASAVVFGEMPACDEPSGEPRARDVIGGLMQDFPGPVLYGFASGHTSTPAITLPFGVTARVVARGVPRLVIEEAAVSTSRPA
jgi:muramoyltetrapeptide carboxypeptidase